MKPFDFIISSPDGNVFEGKIESIILRGASGDLAILAGHIPFATSVKPCECKIVLEDGTEKTGTVDGGLLSVTKEKTTLFSGSFQWK
ncbi:MAG: F0F1 ATP synthase subunit epsilon [Ruminococcaceae bacterium]|nr:F0F1 ATP synthase subunit epsilon [Oscillospiraceae bacterium]